MATASWTYMGEFYPGKSVQGINADSTGFVNDPGTGAKLPLLSFVPKLAFSDATTLINFAEVQLTFNVDLETDLTTLDGHTVTQAANCC
jgi:hypothetical protein